MCVCVCVCVLGYSKVIAESRWDEVRIVSVCVCLSTAKGEPGANAMKGPLDLSAAESEFKKKFTDKTKNKWERREQFAAVPGKYTLLEMADESDDEETDCPAPSTSGPPKMVKSCSLDKPTQRLVDLIFDTDMFQDAMKSFDIGERCTLQEDLSMCACVSVCVCAEVAVSYFLLLVLQTPRRCLLAN